MRKMALYLILFFCGVTYAPTASIHSFNRGEWAPKLEGRQDVRGYYAANRAVENLVVIPQGPVQKRPGSYYIVTASGANRLIRFEHSTEQPYVLEFSDKAMRVCQ